VFVRILPDMTYKQQLLTDGDSEIAHRVRMPGGWKGAAGGFLSKGRPGLPRARHGRFQPAPAAPPQCKAQSRSHHGGTWGESR